MFINSSLHGPVVTDTTDWFLTLESCSQLGDSHQTHDADIQDQRQSSINKELISSFNFSFLFLYTHLMI